MTFEYYLHSLGKKVSDVKALILKTLWEAGDQFPRDSVDSKYLLELTGQKYFDRRTRELIDDNGCDIEISQIGNKYTYRLRSSNIKAGNPRQYLNAAQKKNLFEKADYRCSICGLQTLPGPRGLQADHKTPLIRGGSKDLDNWQAICNDCNVAKRRICKGCTANCETCQWAYPETTGFQISIRLNPAEFDKYKALSQNNPNWAGEAICNLLQSE